MKDQTMQTPDEQASTVPVEAIVTPKMVPIEQHEKQIDDRNMLIRDMLNVVDRHRTAAAVKQNMATLASDWSEVGFSQVVKQELTVVQNEMSALIDAFSKG